MPLIVFKNPVGPRSAGPVTGLLVQPIIGSMSDRTWNRLGRRRPYFLTGAILAIAVAKFKGGQSSELDANQGQSDVSTTEALIEQDLISLRQATNKLCTLLGLPPEDLMKKLGEAPIPTAPPEAAVGVPADLIRRRPDVRRARADDRVQRPVPGAGQVQGLGTVPARRARAHGGLRARDRGAPLAQPPARDTGQRIGQLGHLGATVSPPVSAPHQGLCSDASGRLANGLGSGPGPAAPRSRSSGRPTG